MIAQVKLYSWTRCVARIVAPHGGQKEVNITVTVVPSRGQYQYKVDFSKQKTDGKWTTKPLKGNKVTVLGLCTYESY